MGASFLAIVGLGGGYLIVQEVFKNTRDYDKYHVEKEDFTEVYNRYQEMSKDQYYSSFTPIELVNIGLLNLTYSENVYSVVKGAVNVMGTEQTIRASMVKNGDKYFEENISRSKWMKTAIRFYQEGNKISWYKGSSTGTETSDYSKASLTEYTLSQFENKWGRTSLGDPTVYNVYHQCYLDGSVTDNQDGTHTVELKLDPILSVTRYVKQMMMTGGLDTAPIFHEVKLTYVLDEDLILRSFKTYEVYDVHMVIDAKNSKGSLTQNYYYDYRNIPSLSEQANYEE